MLSGINQTQTKSASPHLHVECNKLTFVETESKMVIAWGGRKMTVKWHKISIGRRGKLKRSIVHHGDIN
jgi:hypothetical protein